MYAADHISAVRRNFESRAMPETEKPPAGPVDIYSKYAFVIRDWTKRRSISGGIYKKIGCNEI